MFTILLCITVVLVLATVLFVVVTVRGDRRRNAFLAEQAERVAQGLYGSRDGAAGGWGDWRARYQHTPPPYQQMARDHRRGPHREVRDPHRVRPTHLPPPDPQDVREPNTTD